MFLVTSAGTFFCHTLTQVAMAHNIDKIIDEACVHENATARLIQALRLIQQGNWRGNARSLLHTRVH